jgi:hypothetical protein
VRNRDSVLNVARSETEVAVVRWAGITDEARGARAARAARVARAARGARVLAGESPRRKPGPSVVALLCVLSFACAKEAPPPPPPAAPPSPIAWAFDPPPVWDDRVTFAEDPQPGSHLSSRVFLYSPRDTSVRPQILLGITVYDSATWARMAAEPGPPQGDSLSSAGGQVFAAGFPQSNPFAEGSADFRTFDSLAVDLARVRQRFRVLR